MSSGTMMGTRWLTDVQQVQWRAYLDASVRLMNALGRQLEQDSDLSLSEYEVLVQLSESPSRTMRMSQLAAEVVNSRSRLTHTCLLYTSDAADDLLCVDLGGRRII